MNRSTKIFLGTLVVVSGVVALWLHHTAKVIPPQAAPVVQSPAPAPTPLPLAEPVPAAPKVDEPTAATESPEVAATARMYAAHAPLRTPEVANPDSKTNKQILQTMVLKALAQSSTTNSHP